MVGTFLFIGGGVVNAMDFEHVVIDEDIGGRTAIGDIDGNGFNDIVVDTWSSDRGKQNDGRIGWSKYPGWQDHSVMADVKDLNNDGKVDVVLSHSENTGFATAWYESENPKGGPDAWAKHEVGVVDDCHTLRGGDIDIVTARSWDKAPLQLWRNTTSSTAGELGAGASPPPGAEVLIDGTHRLPDEKWTYWKGPRFASSLPILSAILQCTLA